MAYRKFKRRITAGSLNVAPTPDLTPGTDSIQIVNFRPDRTGVLWSRHGTALQGGPVVAGNIHSLFRSGDNRYGGAGTSLLLGAALNTSVATGFSGNKLGLAAMGNYLWVMDTSKQLMVDGANSWDWGIPGPAGAVTAADAAVAGNVDGTVVYYVTFDTDDGLESNGGAGSTPLTVVDSQVSLSAIPLGTHPKITRRHIYRGGGLLTAVLRIATISDNTTTTYTDNVSDVEAEALNIELPLDNDAPPAARGLAGPYQGRLLAFGNDMHPGRLWWSKVGRPTAWPGANDEDEGNWEDVGDRDEWTLGVSHNRRQATVFKEYSIWTYPGDPDEVNPEKRWEKGILGRNAWTNDGVYDYFASADGIYRWNGDYAEKISLKVDPIFRGEFSILSSAVTIPPISFANRAKIAMVAANGRLYVSYPEEGQAVPNIVLVCNLETFDWWQNYYALGGWNLMSQEDKEGAILGAWASYLYEIETGDITDAGATFPLAWQTRYDDMGLPDNPKRFGELVVDCQTAYGAETPGDILTVKIAFDNGTLVTLGTIQSTTRIKTRFPLSIGALGYDAENASIRIEGNASKTNIIHAVYLHYESLPRWAGVYDSGTVDFGKERLKEMYDIGLDIHSTDTVTWALHSDVPSGAMAERATGTFVATTTRATQRISLTSAVQGRRFRILLTSPAKFQLFGAKCNLITIGEYFNGAAGEFYQSQPWFL